MSKLVFFTTLLFFGTAFAKVQDEILYKALAVCETPDKTVEVSFYTMDGDRKNGLIRLSYQKPQSGIPDEGGMENEQLSYSTTTFDLLQEFLIVGNNSFKISFLLVDDKTYFETPIFLDGKLVGNALNCEVK